MTDANNSEIVKVAQADKDKVTQVFGWIISGAPEHEIMAAIKEAWPNEPARPLIADAMLRIGQAADADPLTLRAWAICATKLVHQKALEANDLASSLAAVKQIVQLSKLMPEKSREPKDEFD